MIAQADVIGRAAELAFFPPFLDAVAAGPAALVLEGDAGIGKSALWIAAATLGKERGYQVFSSRSAEAETQLPFTGLGDLLGGISEGTLAVLPEPQRRALDVAMLRADWDGPPVERRAVSLAVLGVLRRLAEQAPVILALDDLQWLDSPSSAALQFALRRLETEPVGLLAARRGRGDEIPTDLTQGLSRDRLHRLEVGPLDRDSLGHLLLERLQLRLSRPALVQVHRVSAGNPFLALEIARALERREVTLKPGEPFPIPQGLRELVRDRLEQLPDSARETGLIVAALAQPTISRVEAATAALDLARGAEGLDQALAAGIVEIEGERVRFTHPLLGSIIYSEASAARRRELHARLATLTADVDERAGHLAVAAAGPDAEVAAILDAAAARALGRGAPEAAADFSEQALLLTSPDSRGGRRRRMLAAAEFRFEAGDVQTARTLIVAAIEISSAGPERARGLTRLGSIQVLGHDLAGGLETYERARREAGDEPALLARIEADLAWLCHFSGDRIGASAHMRRAAELSEQVGDAERLVYALVGLALIEGRGGGGDALAFIERAYELERWVKDAHAADRPHWVHALLLAGDGAIDDARDLFLSEYRRALDRGDESSLPTLLEHLTLVERRAGNWNEAERYAHEMYDVAVRGGLLPVYHSWPLAMIQALRGRVDAARELAAAGMAEADRLGIGPVLGGHRAVLGFIELSLANPSGALAYLKPLSDPLTAEIAENGWFRFLADEIEALIALDEIGDAGILVARLAERRGVLHDRAWTRAALPRCRGLVIAAEGNEADAVAAFEVALAEHERLPEPFELGRTLLALGRVQRRFRRRRAARESLMRAREIFSELGAPLWIARTDEELHRIGGRAPRGAGLTPNEERVAVLAADGLTNREIAAKLYLSVNTVQAYLKRVYRELDIRSRTELARKLPPGSRSKSTDSGVSGPRRPS